MKTPRCHPAVYRLPPTKKFPKGLRVRKAVEAEQYPDYMGVLVVAICNGHSFCTKRILTPE